MRRNSLRSSSKRRSGRHSPRSKPLASGIDILTKKTRGRVKKTPGRSKVSKDRLKGGNPDDENSKLRELSKLCADCSQVSNYVSSMLKQINELLKVLEISNHMSLFHKDNKANAGNVELYKVQEVINEGNIREQMTAINNMTDGGCHVLLKLVLICLENEDYASSLEEEHNINLKRITNIKDKIKNTVGFTDDDDLIDYLKDTCTGTNICGVCKSAVTPSCGPVMVSRMVGFPYGGVTNMRSERETPYPDPIKVKIRDIYPSLSYRERKFMNLQNDDVVVPWISGRMYWDPTPLHMYSQLARVGENTMISGISGSSDMIALIMSIFNNFDVDLTALACVAWMGNPPDHSTFEILMGLRPYGCNYTSNGNGDEYIFNLLLEFQCPSSSYNNYNNSTSHHTATTSSGNVQQTRSIQSTSYNNATSSGDHRQQTYRQQTNNQPTTTIRRSQSAKSTSHHAATPSSGNVQQTRLRQSSSYNNATSSGDYPQETYRQPLINNFFS